VRSGGVRDGAHLPQPRDAALRIERRVRGSTGAQSGGRELRLRLCVEPRGEGPAVLLLLRRKRLQVALQRSCGRGGRGVRHHSRVTPLLFPP
jgi:hypothetical protein